MLDVHQHAVYKDEFQTQSGFRYAGMLAIVLACLGLYGLASNATSLRTREIAVRRVVGASVPHLVLLLSRETVRIVLTAVIASMPAAWIFMRAWLNGFSERISFGAGYFLAAAAITLTVALATVAYDTFRAALTKPAVILRRN